MSDPQTEPADHLIDGRLSVDSLRVDGELRSVLKKPVQLLGDEGRRDVVLAGLGLQHRLQQLDGGVLVCHSGRFSGRHGARSPVTRSG